MIKRAAEWLRFNTMTIVIALLLGLIVWIIAYQAENEGNEHLLNNISVEPIGLPEDYRITNTPDDTVDVTIFTQDNTWRALDRREIEASIDLSDLEPGQWDVPVQVGLPEFTALSDINPDTIEVVIERIVERELPIQVITQGNVAVGYRIIDPLVNPSVATIVGPESQVAQVSELRAVVDLGSERRQGFSGEVTVSAFDSEGEQLADLNITPTTAQVRVPVQQETDFKEVSIQPVPINRPLSGYVLVGAEPIPNSIAVQGDEAILEEIAVIYTEVFDLSGLTEDRRFEVGLDLPTGVRAFDSENNEIDQIEVVVSVEPIVTVRELFVPVTIVNLEDDLRTELSIENITVILSGPQRSLNALVANENVIVQIDTSDLEPDTYQLVPEVEIIGFEDIEVLSTIPNVITVEIIEE